MVCYSVDNTVLWLTVVCPVCLSCLRRWCFVAERLDESRYHLVGWQASAQMTLC